jgi:uncharacterized protein
MTETLPPTLATLEDPEPERTPATGRRTVTAREARTTMLVCLGLWAVLFGPALLRNAESGPLGARRTAALAVLRPVTAISDSLSVSRATEGAMRALGLDADAPPGGELELPELRLPPLPPLPTLDPEPAPAPSTSPPEVADVVEPSTPATSPGGVRRDDATPATEPEPEPEIATIRTPSQHNKLRVAVVGDSLSQGLGPQVAEWFDPEVTRVLSLGRQSTGLARPDYFNWHSAMRRIVTEFRPDLVFVLLGSNDDQALVTPDGDPVFMGSTDWVQGYRERAATFLREATSSGTRVVWVGIPVVSERQRWEFYRRLNDIYSDTASADPLATYVDAWNLFESRDGGYTAYLRNERGILQEMRAGDGYHFTPDGYGYLARVAIRASGDAFGLPRDAVRFKI